MIARRKARIHDVIYVSDADINGGFGQLARLVRKVMDMPHLARMEMASPGKTSGFPAPMLFRQSGREKP
jgi:hypothetical protein